MAIDEKDQRILNVLAQNCRLSFREIARKCHLSTVTVLNRMHRLEQEGIIKQYAAVLDYDRLGYDVQVIIDLRISKGKLFEVEKRIATEPNIFALYDNTGHFDATIIGKFRTRSAMDKFLKRIQAYDFVERTETKLILNTIKEGGIRLP